MATEKGKKREEPKTEKQKSLNVHKEEGLNEYLTNNQGLKVNDNQHSLKAGDRGPTLMEDFVFREKMTHFDHERIPERVVHPRGSGAHGVFECYESMEKYTRASFLSEKGKKTPTFTRFSTVVGFRGSSDTARDVRGFATKFYTDEGNFDLVGNNMPVFFIQDAMKFPDLVHSIKPEPHNQMPQATAAHDTFWDFASLMPEATHVIMWVLSGRGIPRSYRMMEGFGVHTFKWINAKGKVTFVKYHWKPVLGTHALLWDEAQKLYGMDPDYHRRDLWDAIEEGHYPEFELGVQLIPEEDEHKFDFDLLDPTKLVPEELVPVKKIGKMTLNRNPDNFFAETEQVAFHPGNVVPGIDFTNDPLLQGRLFSYIDTQLIRLGGPNFGEIPINRPLAESHNNQRDGYMRQTINKGRVNYEPNSLAGGCPWQASMKDGGFVHHAEKIDAKKIRARSKSFNDYFSQATLFWNSQTKAEQKQIISAAQFELGKVETEEIRMRMVGLFSQVDKDFAKQVAEGLGFELPEEPMKPIQRGVPADADPKFYEPVHIEQQVKMDKALSMDHTVKGIIKTRQVAFLCADGVDEESITPMREALMKEGASVKIVAPHLGKIETEQGNYIKVDKSFSTGAPVAFDAFYVPSGENSVSTLEKTAKLANFLDEGYKHAKPIAMSGDALKLLRYTHFGDLAKEKQLDSEGVILRDKYSAAQAKAFIEAIGQHRFWDRPDREKIPT